MAISHCEAMVKQLNDLGIPKEKIVIDDISMHRSIIDNDNYHRIFQSEEMSLHYPTLQLDLISNLVQADIPIMLLYQAIDFSHPFYQNVFNIAREEALESLKKLFDEPRHLYSGKTIEMIEYALGVSNKQPKRYLACSGLVEPNDKTVETKRELCKALETNYNKQGYTSINKEFPIFIHYQEEQGRFIIIDGGHRCSFLYEKGIRRILTTLDYTAYQCFLNSSAIPDVLEWLDEQSIIEIHTPILHPLFYSFPAKYEHRYISRTELVLRWLRNERTYHKSLIDFNCKLGFTARVMKRMGISVTAVDNDREMITGAKLIGALEHTRDIQYEVSEITGFIDQQTYDYGLLFTYGDSKLESLYTKPLFWQIISGNVSSSFFCEVNNREEEVISECFKNTHFTNFLKIGNVNGEEIRSSIFVFYKDIESS